MKSSIHSLVCGFKSALTSFAATAIAGVFIASAQAQVLHTYENSTGHEVVNVIAVDMAKLRPLVPADYTIVPASAVMFGRPDQGIVTIANFQGLNPVVDHNPGDRRPQVDIDLAILIAEPPSAASIGLNLARTTCMRFAFSRTTRATPRVCAPGACRSNSSSALGTNARWTMRPASAI
jgi:hypothetical protein